MPSIEDLQRLIDLDPVDPFPRYGLALELKKRGRIEEALAAFADLLARSPDYVAGHQQLALALEACGKQEEAKAAYRRGIETALRTGDGHAAEEMRGAMEMLG